MAARKLAPSLSVSQNSLYLSQETTLAIISYQGFLRGIIEVVFFFIHAYGEVEHQLREHGSTPSRPNQTLGPCAKVLKYSPENIRRFNSTSRHMYCSMMSTKLAWIRHSFFQTRRPLCTVPVQTCCSGYGPTTPLCHHKKNPHKTTMPMICTLIFPTHGRSQR